jgi:hypothetical protein
VERCGADRSPAGRSRLQAGAAEGNEETIRARTIQARANSQFLTEYAAKFGRTHGELHAHFVGEQAEFVRMFEKSALEKRVFENDEGLDTIVAEVYDFWLRGRNAPGTTFLTANAS